MLLLIKLFKKTLKIISSQQAPWQLFLGALLGVLLGMLPLWQWQSGPNLLAVSALLLAIFINCHLASVLLFAGIGALLQLALGPVAILFGLQLDGLARAAAEIPPLYYAMLSHTQILGFTVLALILGPIAGIIMVWLSRQFETKLRQRLEQRKKLRLAGKVAGNTFLLRLGAWFFDI